MKGRELNLSPFPALQVMGVTDDKDQNPRPSPAGSEPDMGAYEFPPPPPPCASLEVQATRHTVGSGSHPGSTKEPLAMIGICAYDKSPVKESCTERRMGYGFSWLSPLSVGRDATNQVSYSIPNLSPA